VIAPIWTDVSPQGLVRAVEAHEVAHLRSWGELSGGTVDELPDVLLTRSGTSVPWSNGAIGARFETANADRRIAETLEIIRSRGVPATWRVMPSDRPPDLAARLAAAGLEQQPLAWMALDLETLETHAAAAPPAPAGSVQVVSGSGAQGFDLAVQRTVYDRHGKVLRRDTFRSRYVPDGPTSIYGPGRTPPGPYVVIPRH